MKLAQKLSTWLKPVPSFKFLFLLAVFLTLNALCSQQYLKFQQDSNSKQQTNQLINFIITSSDQQLRPLLANNKLEQLPPVLESSLDYELLQGIAIYQADGSLIDKAQQQGSNPKQRLSKVSKLYDSEKEVGYVLYEFLDASIANPKPYHWIFYLAGIIWLLACSLFIFKTKAKRVTLEVAQKAPARVSYKKELQQLLKRSQEQTEPNNLLIISADWEAYNQKPRQPLLSLLNKWTAHNKSHLVSFDKDRLVLGLPEHLTPEVIKKVQVLQLCLRELTIIPTILIHQLGFGESIYQHLFRVVEQGLWLESQQHLNLDSDEIAVKDDIEIEVESFGQFHLYRIDAFKAEDALFIERQTRFFLQ